MEEAFNRRYHWNESFKGFSADFTLIRDGKTVKGTIKADATKPHGGVEVVCDDTDAKKLVSDVVGSTITHTRGSSFAKSFGSASFAIAGDGTLGGTKIALTGHGFFKDFTIKDGNIVENHGGHGEMSTEVKVKQVVWLADSGKTLPRLIRSRSRTATTNNQARTWNPGPRSTVCGFRPGGSCREMKGALRQSRARSAWRTSRWNRPRIKSRARMRRTAPARDAHAIPHES